MKNWIGKEVLVAVQDRDKCLTPRVGTLLGMDSTGFAKVQLNNEPSPEWHMGALVFRNTPEMQLQINEHNRLRQEAKRLDGQAQGMIYEMHNDLVRNNP